MKLETQDSFLCDNLNQILMFSWLHPKKEEKVQCGLMGLKEIIAVNSCRMKFESHVESRRIWNVFCRERPVFNKIAIVS